MSHIEEGKTNLVFQDLPALLREGKQEAMRDLPCMKLLQQAVLLVAQQYGGEVRDYYSTYWGSKRPTNTGLALHIPLRPDKPAGEALPRGIGLVINEQSGALTFRGDSWEVDKNFYSRIQRAIVQKYTVLAHMAALRQMQYQVSTQEVEEGRVQITGVSYAA